MCDFCFELTVNPHRLAIWAQLSVGLDAPQSLHGTSYDHQQYPVLRAAGENLYDLCPMQQGRPLASIEDERREFAGSVSYDKVDTIRCYREALRHRRCVVPADRILKRHHGASRPGTSFRMTLGSGLPFGLAGLWEQPSATADHAAARFTVLTSPVSPALRHYADSLPIVIPDQERERWLDVTAPDVPEDLLTPLEEEDLLHWHLEMTSP